MTLSGMFVSRPPGSDCVEGGVPEHDMPQGRRKFYTPVCALVFAFEGGDSGDGNTRDYDRLASVGAGTIGGQLRDLSPTKNQPLSPKNIKGQRLIFYAQNRDMLRGCLQFIISCARNQRPRRPDGCDIYERRVVSPGGDVHEQEIRTHPNQPT